MAKTTATVNEMELEIDLKEDLGINFPITHNLKEQIGDAVIEKMKERTASNKSLTGSKFKPYTEKYAKMKGVSRDEVDLELFGDMLGSIDIIDIGLDKIKISFDSVTEVPKAFNHHTGDTLPERPFFGIQKKELKQIKNDLTQRIMQEGEQAKIQKRQQKEQERLSEEAIEQLSEIIAGGILDFG